MNRKDIAREIDFVDSIMQSHFNDYGEETHRALQEAVKLIEQEPKTDILDKIRAEIEPKCDRINSLASVLPYAAHREIQELLCEIMDLFEPQESEE